MPELHYASLQLYILLVVVRAKQRVTCNHSHSVLNAFMLVKVQPQYTSTTLLTAPSEA
jgi:hypothetical protein